MAVGLDYVTPQCERKIGYGAD